MRHSTRIFPLRALSGTCRSRISSISCRFSAISGLSEDGPCRLGCEIRDPGVEYDATCRTGGLPLNVPRSNDSDGGTGAVREENASLTMLDPPHPGGAIRDAIETSGWTVTDAAVRMGIRRQSLSRLLNGHTGISPGMALTLERLGWSNASFWMQLQSNWELAQERRRHKEG